MLPSSVPIASTSNTSPAELHLIYVLLDSNLPTGGFVSSSGLESYIKHGFLITRPSYTRTSGSTPGLLTGKLKAGDGVMMYARAEVENYASTTTCFVADAWRTVHSARDVPVSSGGMAGGTEAKLNRAVDTLIRLDQNHEINLLSHVSRRSSKAQGAAMLTLYTRGLSRPATDEDEDSTADIIVERYKRAVRRGDSPGHLSVCWGLITAALGVPLDRTLHLHLFLHARSLLSSAVRLNSIGPYASSQLLLHPMRTLIEETISRYPAPSTGLLSPPEKKLEEDDFWSWTTVQGPATTWPLGEILMSRHDLQHSRIFNS